MQLGRRRLVGATGGHHRHRRRREPRRTVVEQCEGGVVAPVQVLEHQHGVRVRRSQQLEDALGEHQRVLRAGRGDRVGRPARDQPGQRTSEDLQTVSGREGPATPRAEECLADRPQRGSARYALPVQDLRPVVGHGGHHLGDQPGLADAGLAGDHQEAALVRTRPGPAPRVPQPPRRSDRRGGSARHSQARVQ